MPRHVYKTESASARSSAWLSRSSVLLRCKDGGARPPCCAAGARAAALGPSDGVLDTDRREREHSTDDGVDEHCEPSTDAGGVCEHSTPAALDSALRNKGIRPLVRGLAPRW